MSDWLYYFIYFLIAIFCLIILATVYFIRIFKRDINNICKLMKALFPFINSLITFLNINFIDYCDSNCFNEILIEFPKNKSYKEIREKINSKNIQIPIFPFKNKNNTLQVEISLINSNTKIKRVFKISIYNYFINNVNILIIYIFE